MFGIFKKNKPVTHRKLVADPPPVAVALPEEVVRFLRMRDELNTSELMINILDEHASAEASSSMQSTGIGKRLGLFVLDDANDSNPYCYMAAGVAAGMVVHFNHDPEPKIEFESLYAFERFLRRLRAENQELGETETSPPEHPNQIALAAVLAELVRADDSDSEFQLCLYLPLLRGHHERLLEDLAAHQSFFVREAVADAVSIAHLPGSDALVRLLANDPHPQVRSAALRACEKLEHRDDA